MTGLSSNEVKIIAAMLGMDPPRLANDIQKVMAGKLPLATINSALRRLLHRNYLRVGKVPAGNGRSRIMWSVTVPGVRALERIRDVTTAALAERVA